MILNFRHNCFYLAILSLLFIVVPASAQISDTVLLKKMDSAGVAFEKRSEYDSALHYYNYLKAAWIRKGKKEKIGLYYLKTGRVKAQKGDMEGAVSDYFKLLNIATETNDINKQMIAFTRIGRCYESLGNDDAALKIYYRAFKLGGREQEKIQMVFVCNSIASIYLKSKNFDSAFSYLSAGEKIANETNNPNNLYAIANGYGLYFLEKGLPQKSVEYFQKAMKIIHKTFPGSDFETGIYINLGAAFIALNQFDKAKLNLEEALALSRNTGNSRNLSEIYLNLAELHAKKNDFKRAFDFASQYNSISDSLSTEESTRKIAEMQALFDLKQKEKQIREAKARQLILTEKLNAQKRTFFRRMLMLAVLVPLLFLALFSVYRIHATNKKLAKQKVQMEQQRIEIRKKHFLVSKFQAQMSPHFIFNSINGLQHILLGDNQQDFSERLDKLSNLMKSHFGNSGATLIPLREEVEFLNTYLGLEKLRFAGAFEYAIEIHPKLDPTKISIPPMIIQPFLENSINHGLLPGSPEYGTLKISFDEIIRNEEKTLRILIEDNGIGRVAAAENSRKRNSGHKSRGMEITQDRVDLCWQPNFDREFKNVQVHDLYDERGNAVGTRVEVLLPLAIYL
jgi:tetratricopeptide (TPR) repeat protein